MHLFHDLDELRTFDDTNFSKSGIPIIYLFNKDDEQMMMPEENSYGKNKTNYLTKPQNTKINKANDDQL